jgi:ABC-type cobalamin transport system ATPase subunit
MRAAGSKTGLSRLLVGPRGCGKSATLLHLVQWARAQGWIVMYAPRPFDWISDRGAAANGTGTGGGSLAGRGSGGRD